MHQIWPHAERNPGRPEPRGHCPPRNKAGADQPAWPLVQNHGAISNTIAGREESKTYWLTSCRKQWAKKGSPSRVRASICARLRGGQDRSRTLCGIVWNRASWRSYRPSRPPTAPAMITPPFKLEIRRGDADSEPVPRDGALVPSDLRGSAGRRRGPYDATKFIEPR
jgi:hypothetical protein